VRRFRLALVSTFLVPLAFVLQHRFFVGTPRVGVGAATGRLVYVGKEQVDGYDAMAAEMLELGRGMPGFIDLRSFHAKDSEELSVAWWEDDETLAAWPIILVINSRNA